jgi:hypothetical protein
MLLLKRIRKIGLDFFRKGIVAQSGIQIVKGGSWNPAIETMTKNQPVERETKSPKNSCKKRNNILNYQFVNSLMLFIQAITFKIRKIRLWTILL